jgi:hypothetical protein
MAACDKLTTNQYPGHYESPSEGIMATPTLDRETILRAVADWPVEDQMGLARAIAEHASSRAVPPTASAETDAASKPSWETLHGIASNSDEPPSDEQVKQWLDEHKKEKYGH